MTPSRRRFFKSMAFGGGGTLAAATWWIATSKQRVARWARIMVADARRTIKSAPHKPKPSEWNNNQVTLSWIGHSTVLINFFGIHVLTDPVFGNRVGVSLGIGTAGPKRYIAPALTMKELPLIDVIMLSHAHMDHMDIPSLRSLTAPMTVTAKLTASVIAPLKLPKVVEMNWGDRVTFRGKQGDLEITAFEVKHWGERWPSDLERGYNGYSLRRENKAILFGGDTATTPLFSQLKSKGPFEAAIMPIGAYDPWINNHCNPEQAVDMANAAGARYIVPVHHQTFRLSNEPMSEPIERIQIALEKEPERLALRDVGESFSCPS